MIVNDVRKGKKSLQWWEFPTFVTLLHHFRFILEVTVEKSTECHQTMDSSIKTLFFTGLELLISNRVFLGTKSYFCLDKVGSFWSLGKYSGIGGA